MNQPQNITFDVPNAFELEKLSELHKAMGDFTRTKILWQLMQGEQCAMTLQKHYPLLILPYLINSMHSGLQN